MSVFVTVNVTAKIFLKQFLFFSDKFLFVHFCYLICAIYYVAL